jgi:hypothetical protein
MAKARRPTSWERRRAKQATEAPADKALHNVKVPGEEAALNAACAAAKLASEDARQRHREFQAPLPGDDELVAAYTAAKQKMREWHEARNSGSRPTQKRARDGHPPPDTARSDSSLSRKAKKPRREDGERRLRRQQQAAAAAAAGTTMTVVSPDEKDSKLPAAGEARQGAPVAAPAATSHAPTRATTSEHAVPWHCAVCNITISVRPDGRARAQHEAGAKHKEKVQERASASRSVTQEAAPLLKPAVSGVAAAVQRAGSRAASASPQASVSSLAAPQISQARAQAPPSAGGDAVPWRCAVCNITISVRPDGRARMQHEAGAKHKAALELKAA